MASDTQPEVIVEVVRTPSVFEELFALRREVFIEEQKVDPSIESDSCDLEASSGGVAWIDAGIAIYVVARLTGGDRAVVGTARLVATHGAYGCCADNNAGGGSSDNVGMENAKPSNVATPSLRSGAHEGPMVGKWGKIGRVAVKKESRKMGIGRLMMVALEEEAKQAPFKLDGLYLGGQVQALQFYEAVGYTAIAGSAHVQAGIDHVWFEMLL
eukprot:gene4845-34602_t